MSAAAATIVTGTPPPVPPTQVVTPPPVDTAALQKQIDDFKAASEENARAADFWKKKAETAPTPAPVTAAEPKEDEEDVLDVLATRGAKGLDALLAKRGYVRGDEVDSRVNQKAAELQKEQNLIAQYPDLKKESSDFFKETAQAYGTLVKQGVSKAVAMEMAAERTELKFLREGKLKTPVQQAADDKTEKDRLKQERIKAQASEGVRGRSAPEPDDDDAELTAEQKHIADAMGITHEAYSARAKKGVQMKGIRA